MSVDYIFTKTNPDQTTTQLHKADVITAFKSWIDNLSGAEKETALSLYNAQQDKINSGIDPDEASTPELDSFFARFCSANSVSFKYKIVN
jgi:hypothetical protein